MHIIRTTTAAAIISILLGGCLSRQAADPGMINMLEEPGKPAQVSLTVFYDKNGQAGESIAQACHTYSGLGQVGIDIRAPGASYEETLKTMMASNSLPDVFTTHGWSVKRYAPYLRPLNDQPWKERVKPGIRPLITDRDGNVYVLPVTMQQEGIVYHIGVLQASGVDPDAIRTWDDFELALQAVHQAGYVPLAFGGKDTWTIAVMLDYIATANFDRPAMENACAALLEGNFDWYLWTPVSERLYSWVTSGYVDPDSLTRDYITAAREFGSGNVAFSPGSGVRDALEAYPDARFGVIPVPVFEEAQESFIFGGEDIALGIWRDTPHMKESLKLLEFFSAPETCEKIAAASLSPPGLDGVEMENWPLEYPAHFFELRVLEYFDRRYLPSGMWDEMSNTGALLLSGRPGAVEESVEQMKQSYREKFS